MPYKKHFVCTSLTVGIFKGFKIRSLFLLVAVFAAGCAAVDKQAFSNRCESAPRKHDDTDGLTSNIALEFLLTDWRQLDKNTEVPSFTPDGLRAPPHWFITLTPPFPLSWPPEGQHAVSYYAYATSEQFHIHGPLLSFSAPWAKVTLQEGTNPKKEVFSKAIGPVFSMRSSHPLTIQEAQNRKQVQKDGEENIPILLTWNRLPNENDRSVIAIKAYYCQWGFDNLRIASKIKAGHAAFVDWLGCPNSFNY